jgi:hypothetical protein
MKKTLVLITTICLALAAGAGCKKKDKEGGGGGGAAGGGGGAKPSADMTVDQACDKTMSMMSSMVKAIEANKGNCDGMGTALEKWVADNKAFIEWGKKMDADEAKKKEFDEKCTPKLTAEMEKMMPAMMGAMECAENEKVKAAMESMGG